MYIPEFVCGIAFTLLAEVFLSVLWYLRDEEMGGDADGKYI